MDSILGLLSITYPYPSLNEQRRSAALTMLIRIAVGLAIAVVLILVLTWTGRAVSTALVPMAPILVITAMLALYLGNRGHLGLASWIYVGASILGTLFVVAIDGLTAMRMMTLAIPFFVAGLVLDKRGVVLVTGALVFGLLVLGVGWALASEGGDSVPFRVVLEPILLLLVFGIAEWLLLQQIQDSFGLITRTEGNLNAGVQLSEIINEAESEDGLLREFALRAQRSMDLSHVQIFLVEDRNASALRLRAAAGAAAQRALLDERTVSLSAEQLLTTAAKTREPQVARITDLANARTGFFPGTHAELAIPLVDGDRLLGVIDLQSAFADAFDFQAIETNMLAGRQLALALRNLRLATHLTEAGADQAQLQRHIAQLSTEVQRLQRQTSGTVWEEFFRARDSRSLGFDFAQDDVEPRSGQGLTPNMSKAMQTGKVQVAPAGQGHRLTIPIVMRGEVLGAMEFNIQRSGVLPERLVELATTVSERLSLSLDNARLVEQTQAVAFREQQVSNISGRLQSASSMEELIALAAAEFSEAMDGALTHIRMQPSDSLITQTSPPTTQAAGQNGGGAA
jgi:putative methionine-R-sulfoxide reductase with GAF domain